MTKKAELNAVKAKKSKGGQRSNHASTRSIVSAYLAVLPIIRRLERTYRLRSIGVNLILIMAHRGAMTPYGLMMAYYGYNGGETVYRGLRASLSGMRDMGLVVNGGGKWWLTEKGERVICGDDQGD